MPNKNNIQDTQTEIFLVLTEKDNVIKETKCLFEH